MEVHHQMKCTVQTVLPLRHPSSKQCRKVHFKDNVRVQEYNFSDLANNIWLYRRFDQ